MIVLSDQPKMIVLLVDLLASKSIVSQNRMAEFAQIPTDRRIDPQKLFSNRIEFPPNLVQ